MINKKMNKVEEVEEAQSSSRKGVKKK